ncbi:MAG: rod shape-determining protein MreD [Acidimicrobiales bacterium]
MSSGVAADPRFRVPLLLLLVVFAQTMLATRLDIAGVVPDVMLLVAIAGGITGGPARGAALGFGAGLVIDVFLQSPFGMSALVYSLVGYAVGVAHGGVLQSSWYLPVLTALLASMGAVLLFTVVSAVLGQPVLVSRLPVVVAVVASVNAVLAPVVVPLVGWSLARLPK